MIVPSYHYMVGPTAAFLALGVVVLLARWVFSTKTHDERVARARARAASRGDYGLLVPVATSRTGEEAEALRARVTGAGIRCTIARDDAPPGSAAGTTSAWQLLVFRTDAARAGELVRSS